jgi:hypothetical protein
LPFVFVLVFVPDLGPDFGFAVFIVSSSSFVAYVDDLATFDSNPVIAKVVQHSG